VLIGRSTFETEHRFMVNLGYTADLLETGYDTSFNLFFERRSGKPINYLLGVKENNGPIAFNPYVELSPGTTNNYFLPFIPKKGDTSVVKFATPAQETQFWNTVTALGLDKYQGQYLPKGSADTPWVTTLDLSVRQELPGFSAEHKGEVYFVVDNLLNLIDSSKGKVYGDDFGDLQLAEFTLDQTTKQYIYNNVSNNLENFDKFYSEESTWRVKVGVAYKF